MTETEQSVFLRVLAESTTAIGISLDEEQQQQGLRFTELLLETNKTLNLTRIVAPDAMAVKHFADALTVLTALRELPEAATVIDVGTGAGFPGIALKIARPKIRLTLLDSVAKRLAFLRSACEGLGWSDVAIVHARAEEAGRDPAYRERFDLVTARAVAALPVLLEWCGPFVKPKGRFVAMKGANVAEELVAATNVPARLGLRFDADVTLTLPQLPDDLEPAQRHLLMYTRIASQRANLAGNRTKQANAKQSPSV